MKIFSPFTLSLFLLSLILSGGIAAQGKRVTPTLYQQADKQKMTHWVDSVFTQMTIDQRIGQLFMIMASGSNTKAYNDALASYIKNQHIGGILFAKGTPVAQAKITNAAQAKAKIPLMIALDGEWGLAMRLENTAEFPHNMALGAIQNDSLLYLYGREVARQCRLMGIHVNFAPDIDVNSNPQNPVIGNRSFGEDPKRVASKGIMYAKGLEAGGIMAVAKHFPGHGDTSADSHKTLPLVSHNRKELDNIELYPFRSYINAQLSGIMVGHLSVPALDSKTQPSSLSKAITTDLLQNELGFSGLVFTDGLAMQGVANEKDFPTRAILAGNDILLGSPNVVKEYASIKQAIDNKLISEEWINEKCKKILSYKYILGLHKIKPIDTKTLNSQLNTTYSDWLNRKLYASAITLLKNKDSILPLKELAERKIAAVSIGSTAGNPFHKSLQQYGNVTCFNVTNGTELAALKTKLNAYNTILFSVHTTKANANNAIVSIAKGKETVLAFFTSPYHLSSYEAAIQNIDALVVGYDNSDLAQEYTAQGLFGGNEMNGKLPVSLKGLFDAGKGINTAKTRLAYNLPEEVGIASAKMEGIERIVKEGIAARAFPGCQVLVVKDGIVIYQRSFGTLEYTKPSKVTDASIYDLASMTKASATLPALMKLYGDKHFSVNDPLGKFVPLLKNTDKAKITIREALLHESGLRPSITYYMQAIDTTNYKGKLFNKKRTLQYTLAVEGGMWANKNYTYKSNIVSSLPKSNFVPLANGLYVNKSYKDSIVKAIADSELGKKNNYLYSCLNFILLKEVVEAEAKTDLNSFVQANFFDRLGATTTSYNPLALFNKSIIAPTERDYFLRKQLVHGYVHDEAAAFMGGISGNAGLFSNANDLAKLYQLFLNKGSYGGETYLTEKTVNFFTSSRSANSRRGYGFDRPELRTNKHSPTSLSTPASVYGHTGFTGTCFWIDPDNQLIYIFLSNHINESRENKQLNRLAIRERIQELLYTAIRKK